MKRYILLTQLLTVLFFCSISIYGQESDELPSEMTWKSINEANSLPSTDLETDLHPTLRKAPPGGESIGETPVGDCSYLLFCTGGLLLYIFRRTINRKDSIEIK